MAQTALQVVPVPVPGFGLIVLPPVESIAPIARDCYSAVAAAVAGGLEPVLPVNGKPD